MVTNIFFPFVLRFFSCSLSMRYCNQLLYAFLHSLIHTTLCVMTISSFSLYVCLCYTSVPDVIGAMIPYHIKESR